MAFDKTIEARVWGVTNQNSDVRLPIGDSSGGTFTSKVNPLRGTVLWDDCFYVLHGVSVAGGATGGSYTVTVQTDVIPGYTGMPIARASSIGPLTKTTVVMDNLHKSKASPMPTHLFIDQTATGGGLWAQCWAVFKQYRGTMGNVANKTSERVMMGNLFIGNSSTRQFGSDAGVAADTTFTFGTTGNDLGMNRVRLWDTALYWAVAGVSLSGTHDFNIIGRVGGRTFTIATTGVAGAMSAAGEKIAIPSQLYGQSPNPTQLIWDVVSAGGVSDSRIVGMAKTGRGSMGKQ